MLEFMAFGGFIGFVLSVLFIVLFIGIFVRLGNIRRAIENLHNAIARHINEQAQSKAD